MLQHQFMRNGEEAFAEARFVGPNRAELTTEAGEVSQVVSPTR